mmetsp:Transcript_6214/g.13165  ORF Transcript_6214/g.13165 Transcript_6214/m.13165 type:complete len:219 (+) Transcript_6214:522-1178(+)
MIELSKEQIEEQEREEAEMKALEETEKRIKLENETYLHSSKMRILSGSSVNKHTQMLTNNMMAKVVKTDPLRKQENLAQTGMNDLRNGGSMDLLNELVSKLSANIEHASELYMIEDYNKIKEFLGTGSEGKRDKQGNMQSKDKDESVSASMTSHVSDSGVSIKDSGDKDEKKDKETFEKDEKVKMDEQLDESLLKPLKVMHKIVNQNIYSQKQIIFKN